MRSVNDIMPMIGARFYTQLDAAQMRNDVIEEDLAKVQCNKSIHILASMYINKYKTVIIMLNIVYNWLRLFADILVQT